MKKFLILLLAVLMLATVLVACNNGGQIVVTLPGEGTDPDPDDTTTEPDQTTAAPDDDTTKAPDDTTKAPDDTTKAPDDTTKAPDDTTEPPAACDHAETEAIGTPIPASCTAMGKTEGKKCAACGEIIEAQQDIPMLNHTEYTLPAEAATCQKEGKTAGKKCAVCSTVLVKQETVAKIAHKCNKIGECSMCHEICPTEGLSFTMNSDGTYRVTGIGTATDSIVIIPATHNGAKVTQISSGAFISGKFTGVVIPEGVKVIEGRAFYGCLKLESVILPSTLTSIGERAFFYCKELKAINFVGTRTQWSDVTKSPDWDKDASTYTMAYGVTTGFKHAHVETPITAVNSTCSVAGLTEGAKCLFCDTVLKEQKPAALAPHTFGTNDICTVCGSKVVGTPGLVFIATEGGYAVTGIGTATGLSSIIIPEVYLGKPVVSVADNAFKNLTNLKTVQLPRVLTNIGVNAFSGCTSLTTINLPEGLEQIRDSAFANCTKLTGITIPNTVQAIGDSAFENCQSLSSINLPDKLYLLSRNAFAGCSKIKTVEIPTGRIKSIGEGAFKNCTSLSEVFIPSSVTTINTSAFEGCNALTMISYQSYESDWNSIIKGDNWNRYTGSYVMKYNVDPTVPGSGTVGTNPDSGSGTTWKCECGNDCTDNFCPNCGKPKPVSNTWYCGDCGAQNNGNFCTKCGKPKP